MANLLAFRALDHLKKYCSDTQNKLSIANNKTFYIQIIICRVFYSQNLIYKCMEFIELTLNTR